MKALLSWALGIGGLAVVYGVFELPGLLIGLFVGAGLVTANRWRHAQDQKRALGLVDIEGVQIAFGAMTMRDGEDEYVLRRSEGGKWERRPVSPGAIGVVVSRRMNSLSDEQNLLSINQGKARLLELSQGDLNAVIPTGTIAKVMDSLPPGSAGRHLIRDMLEKQIAETVAKGGFSQDDADKLFKGHRDQELLDAIKEWLEDGGGWEELPIFEAPIETAYQRYIHQG